MIRNKKLPKEMLVATGNQGKFKEISDLLSSINVKAVSAANFNIIEPEEDGLTFEENSLIKAKFYANKTDLVAIADDSGLCVDAIDGNPGIYSARWAKNLSNKTDFSLAFDKIYEKLEQKKLLQNNQKITAHFICNLTIYDPKDKFFTSFEGRVDGFLTFPARGNLGFGYDPIFIKDGMDQTFGEISPQLKDKISHRFLAFEKMVNWFNSERL
jgi:XTP/dITP diphosphohydrolase